MESTVKFFISLTAVCLGISSGGLPMNMEQFIRTVEQTEGSNPNLTALSVVRSLRQVAGYDNPFIRHYLEVSNVSSEHKPTISHPEHSRFICLAVHHKVTDQGKEEGVVLCGDGTTVALGPVLLGIEGGLLAGTGIPPKGLCILTLAKTLGLSFLHNHNSISQSLGPDGCWDNVTTPKNFTLSGAPSLATDALINGGMDGMLLGVHLSSLPTNSLQLSAVLKGYYRQGLQGPDAPPLLISAFRRDNFGQLVNISFLQEQVLSSLALLRKLHEEVEPRNAIVLEDVVRTGVQEFIRRYIECPAIIPRCQWGARPYRGTPVQLKLPLSFVYIHHTLSPVQPCHSFQKCAANMRAIQRFHQDVRGWDDIGYSFVVGSDGFLYEGRGWERRGAHTQGQNSRGYGISFIGDYNDMLPSLQSLRLVRDRMATCGVGGGWLVSNFSWHGHRQLVNTKCPGEALYAEIQNWKGFQLRGRLDGGATQL